jgi:hypothetical protein
MIKLPHEIIRYILEFNANHYPYLQQCHIEMLENRSCFYKRVFLNLTNHTWNNIKNNITLHIPYGWTIVLERHAIEVTPKHNNNRSLILYYGWSKMFDSLFWKTIVASNNVQDMFTPGYY